MHLQLAYIRRRGGVREVIELRLLEMILNEVDHGIPIQKYSSHHTLLFCLDGLEFPDTVIVRVLVPKVRNTVRRS